MDLRALTLLVVPLSVVAVAACGGAEPAPVAPPATAAPTAAPAEPPAVAPSAAPTAAPTAAPAATAEAAATASPADGAKRPPSGRPPVLRTAAEEIVDTFGFSPAAKLELGEGETGWLRIPEYALDRAYNITFKIEKKAKGNGSVVGKIYRTMAQVAGSPDFSSVTSAGDPFELALPAGAKKDANLAVGEISTDSKGFEKVTWHVVAPRKIDDATNKAYFDLPVISDAYLHVTTKPPSAKK